MCPRDRFTYYKRLFQPVLCNKKDWAIFLHFIYCYSYVVVTNYLTIKLLVTDNFSACRYYPLYLWVIKLAA